MAVQKSPLPRLFCQACRAVLTPGEVAANQVLCGDCLDIIDQATDALLEQAHFDLGEDGI
jgi:hypothetical protein